MSLGQSPMRQTTSDIDPLPRPAEDQAERSERPNSKRPRIAELDYPRFRVSQACNVCRLRKTRCSGDRPCKFCSERNIECISDQGESLTKDELSSKLDEVLQRVELLEHSVQGTLLGSELTPNFLSTRSEVSNDALNTMSEETERHQRDHQPTSTSDDHVSFTQDQVRTSTSFLWQIPIPSLWSIAQRYAGRGQNAGLDPSNGALPGFIHLLLGSQPPFACYAQESRLASEFVAGGDLPAVAVPTRPMLKKYRGDYFVKANDWFPLLSANRWTSLFELAEASWHQDDSLHVAIILLTMALGAAPDQPDSSVTSSPAHGFFRQAIRIVGRAMTFTPALEIAQAKFLIGQYCLLNLQPMLAALSIGEATLQCMLLRRSGMDQVQDQEERHHYQRAFWCCAVLEGEISIHIQTRQFGSMPMELSLTSDWFSGEGHRHTLFFLAETQIRHLQGRIMAELCEGHQLKNKPLVVEELQSQLEKWKQILPEDIQFSIADCRPLFDDHREFLRMQFHCAQALLCWPTIVSVIDAIEQGSETPLAAELATKCNLFAASAVMIFQGAVEQLCSRTVVTWLVCEAVSVIMTEAIIIMHYPNLAALLPPDIYQLCSDVLDCMGLWRSCPRVERSHRILRDSLQFSHLGTIAGGRRGPSAREY